MKKMMILLSLVFVTNASANVFAELRDECKTQFTDVTKMIATGSVSGQELLNEAEETFTLCHDYAQKYSAYYGSLELDFTSQKETCDVAQTTSHKAACVNQVGGLYYILLHSPL
jgi:hypothetical protein